MPAETDSRPLAEVIRTNLLAEIARRSLDPAQFVQSTLGVSRVSAYRRLGASRRNDSRARSTDDLLPFTPPEVDLMATALGISTDLLTARDPFHPSVAVDA